jgi:hypothetical protein
MKYKLVFSWNGVWVVKRPQIVCEPCLLLRPWLVHADIAGGLGAGHEEPGGQCAGTGDGGV